MNTDEQQGPSSPAQPDTPTQADTPNQSKLLQVPPVSKKKRAFVLSPSKPTAPAKKLAVDINSQILPKPAPFAATVPQEIDDLFTRPRASTQRTASFVPRPLLFGPLPNRQYDMPQKDQTEPVGQNTEEGRNEATEEAEQPGMR